MSDGYNKRTRGVHVNPKVVERGPRACAKRPKPPKCRCPYCGYAFTMSLDQHLMMVPDCHEQDHEQRKKKTKNG